ncbi:hypothetical protein BXZ70DRAFT_686634 [Cristinia sonorae]|uniref:Uncharacterized protein n=1 Tax=Cristinia sonorae TaxID=1940300 RepID=A0A8K0UTR9_9AGAR|nr:hypothetical protein BXZ70DRAFT_686634 [Cristinia sonorae]
MRRTRWHHRRIKIRRDLLSCSVRSLPTTRNLKLEGRLRSQKEGGAVDEEDIWVVMAGMTTIFPISFLHLVVLSDISQRSTLEWTSPVGSTVAAALNSIDIACTRFLGFDADVAIVLLDGWLGRWNRTVGDDEVNTLPWQTNTTRCTLGPGPRMSSHDSDCPTTTFKTARTHTYSMVTQQQAAHTDQSTSPPGVVLLFFDD